MSEYQKLCRKRNELIKTDPLGNDLKIVSERLKQIDKTAHRFHRPIGNYKK